jgi:hypothetical protein
MKDFKQSQVREDYMWSTYGTIIKDTLTKNNPDSKIERVNGMLDYDCGIDAVVKLPMNGTYSVRFISLRILNHNYDNFTFRIPHTKSKKELFKLLSPYNPAPYYHVQITEGCNGTQIAVLNIFKLSKYVEDNPEFWEVISNYIKKGERNNYYSIPKAKFERFIKIVNID